MRKSMIKLIGLLAVMLIPFNVFASDIFGDLEMASDATRGTPLEVGIKLSQSGNDKIDVFQGVIEFDENVFSGIDENSFKVQNGWADFEYNKETHALIVINKYGSTLNENIITFNMYLTNNARPGSASVSLKNMIVANENGDIHLDDVSKKVEVNLASGELAGVKVSDASNAKALKNDPVRIYYTLTLILLELMFAFILVLIYKFGVKRLPNVIQRRMICVALCFIEFFALSIFFKLDDHKGDLNNDKDVNYTDVIALSQHLVNSQMLSNFRLENADLNGDGKLTPTDIAILLHRTYSNTEYAVKLDDVIMESNGYEKNSVVDLRFLANVTNDEIIEYAIINGKKYKVEKSESNSNEYFIKMPLSDESKEYNYDVTEVILANGQSAKVDYKTSIVVLKDVPTLSGFASKSHPSKGTVSVALTITDNDDAITNAYYELVDSSGRVKDKGTLSKGKNAIEVSLQNAVSYKFKIKIDYNRGRNSGEYYGTIEDSYDLKVVTNYQFKISNLKLVQNGVETKNLEKNTETELVFNSSNVSGYAPRKVNIGGKEYKVSKLGKNRYSVKIPNTLLNGAPITISKVILANGKVFLTKVSANYNILSKKPEINISSVNEDLTTSKVNVNLNVTDEDNTINSVVVKLYDLNGNLISSENANNGYASLATRDTSKYIIKVFATYNRLPNSSDFIYYDELMSETTLDAKARAYVNIYNADNIYPEKNSVIKLNYNITSNYAESVSQVVINNVIYDVQKVGINNYQVELDVGDLAGVKNYKTQKVILANGLEANVNNDVNVDVLKEYPMLENLEISENTEEGKISLMFDFFDKDGSFTSGRVRLSNKETNEEIISENIIIGKNSMEFTLENAVKYNLDVLIDATLDTMALNPESPNIVHDYNLYNTEYRIINDYRLEIADISGYKDGEKNDFLEKNTKIKLGFTSSNVSEYVPVKVKVDGQYYDVIDENGVYTFEIEGFEEAGVKTLNFESIVLSNLVELSVECTKKIEILKSVPIVTELETVDVDSNATIKINVEDNDNILNNLKAIVTTEAGDEIFNNTIDREITFARDETLKYYVKVYGSYDLDTNELVQDQFEFIDQELFSKVIEKRGE